MIGIKDTLEFSAKHHGLNDRFADQIFGVTRGLRGHERRLPPIATRTHPLRRYTRNSIFGMPGGIGHGIDRSTQSSPRRQAA